ncbi:hypothetical protein [Herbiconiux sp. A18JL235]|uniref:Integral membrane protein n=1 Tax=Herbiconiux sp. A18JL235 TaxID=3152363 RepID=A0AB39BIU6_9MICO
MTGQGDRGAEREVERWLRREGLPAFVRRESRGDLLLARTLPFLVFLLITSVVTSGLVRGRITLEVNSTPLGIALGLLVLFAALVALALPIVVGALTARLLHRSPGAAVPIAVAAGALYLVAVPIAVAVWQSPTAGAATAASHIALTALSLALTWLGAGSLVASALTTAWRQTAAVGLLVTRALPILMLVIVFAFFSRPVWEVTSTMSAERLLAVAVFFGLLGLLFVVPISRSEMRELENAPSETDAPGHTDASAGTPPTGAPPLSRGERLNLQAGLVVALVLQTVLFSVIVCLILLLLGVLALSEEVLHEWVGDRLVFVRIVGIEVPFTWALVKTAVFLSCISSLNFLVSATTNTSYREAFFHPMVDGARTALGVRAAYRAGRTDVALPRRVVTPPGRRRPGHSGRPADEQPDAEPGMVEPGAGSAG